MPINLHNYISVQKNNTLEVEIPDEDAGLIPTDKTNLIVQAMQKTFDYAKADFIPVKLIQKNNIPFARGLGSSAACIVGGVLIANKLMEDKLTFDEILNIAVSMDGHPDNVLPALTGGLTAAMTHEGKVKYVQMMPNEKFKFVFMVPDFHLKTADARKVLPDKYSFRDAVSSVGRAVVFTSSLVNGNESNLKAASCDLLHQPYRKSLIPHFDYINKKAYAYGAHAFFLSGAGPTIACIISDSNIDFVKNISEYLKTLGNYEIITSYALNQGAQII